MSNTMTLAAAIAAAVIARNNSIKSGNKEWKLKWEDRLNQLADCLPSGSGVDKGTAIGWGSKSPDTDLVFVMEFHHMDSNGSYDGWTEHVLYVKATFDNSFKIRVTGKDKNGIKDYLAELLADALRTEAPDYPWATEAAEAAA
jgi:hypothetical protein